MFKEWTLPRGRYDRPQVRRLRTRKRTRRMQDEPAFRKRVKKFFAKHGGDMEDDGGWSTEQLVWPGIHDGVLP